MWTPDEWALLVDLFRRFAPEIPPEREVKRVQYVLRAAALTSEDPGWRRSAADPSFRSLGGVWTQYYRMRRTREFRELGPSPLREIWDLFDRDPEYVSLLAQEFRDRVAGEDNPYGVRDDAALRLFLIDVTDLLGESVKVLRGLPASRASGELINAHAAAWADLKRRDLLPAVLDELEGRDALLNEVGLTGVQLGFKLTGWFRAWTE
jgi:hypothetical protein